MLNLSDPLQRTALGAFVGLGSAALLTESDDPPLSDYLSVPATYIALTGLFGIGAYFVGRKEPSSPMMESESSDLSGPTAYKSPSDGEVTALRGEDRTINFDSKDFTYVDIVGDTFENETKQHQPMRAITMVAGFVGSAAAIAAMRSRPDFRLEGVALAGLGGLIGVYNAYNMVRVHQEMGRRYVAQMTIAG
jgi:hypothetical protein